MAPGCLPERRHARPRGGRSAAEGVYPLVQKSSVAERGLLFRTPGLFTRLRLSPDGREFERSLGAPRPTANAPRPGLPSPKLRTENAPAETVQGSSRVRGACGTADFATRDACLPLRNPSSHHDLWLAPRKCRCSEPSLGSSPTRYPILHLQRTRALQFDVAIESVTE